MGYTHYWRAEVPTKYAEDEWNKFKETAKRIVAAAESRGLKIRGPLGGAEDDDGPEFTEDEIAFNGDAALNQDYETFMVDRVPRGFSFCKTARKPYDAAVVACLLAAERYLPGFHWSSDGDSEADYKDEGQALLDAIDSVEEEVP